jgi:hypothetical protein
MLDQRTDQRRYHQQHRRHRCYHGCPEGSNPAAAAVRTGQAEEDMGPDQRGMDLAAVRSSPSGGQAGSSRPAAVAAGRDRECLGKGRRRRLAGAGWDRLRREEGTRSWT